MLSINEAVALMECYHAGQVDKAGAPYAGHPFRAMGYLPADATDVERQAALFHDVLEDTDITAEQMLADGVEHEAIELVKLLTRPATREPGIAGSYHTYILGLISTNNRSLIRVKLADVTDNSDPARTALLPEKMQNIKWRYMQAKQALEHALSNCCPKCGVLGQGYVGVLSVQYEVRGRWGYDWYGNPISPVTVPPSVQCPACLTSFPVSVANPTVNPWTPVRDQPEDDE